MKLVSWYRGSQLFPPRRQGFNLLAKSPIIVQAIFSYCNDGTRYSNIVSLKCQRDTFYRKLIVLLSRKVSIKHNTWKFIRLILGKLIPGAVSYESRNVAVCKGQSHHFTLATILSLWKVQCHETRFLTRVCVMFVLYFTRYIFFRVETNRTPSPLCCDVFNVLFFKT